MSMYTESLRPAQVRPGFARIVGQTLTWLGLDVAFAPRLGKGLEHLDDHLLRDIGLTRADVDGTGSGSAPIPDIEARRLRL